MGEDALPNRASPALEGMGSSSSRPLEAAPNELWEWLRLLNRRKSLIVGAGLVAVAMMALIIAQATPLYKASSRIMLDTRTFKVVSTEAALSGVDTLNLGAIQSELEVIQSEFLIGRVVDRLGLASNPDFNGTRPPCFLDTALEPVRELWHSGIASVLAPAPKQVAAPAPAQRAPRAAGRTEDSDPGRRSAIGAVSGGLSVSLLGRSFVIMVTVESPDGAMSARVANAIAEVYLADQVDNKNEANRRATEWLEERLAELRRNLQVAEEAVATYRRDKGLSGSPEAAVSSQSLTELNNKYISAKTRRIEKEGRLVALSKASLNPNELANIAEVASNSALGSLRTQESELTRKVAELSIQFGPNHPRLIQAHTELASVRSRFLQQTQSITLAIRAELDAAKSEEEELKTQVERASVLSGATSQYEAELKQLEREAQSNRALYESFLNRFKELREQQDIQRADARILAYAWPSTSPSSPNYKTGLFAAFIIGCLLGVAGSIAAEKLDRVFRSASQVETATGVAVLGMVPLVKGAMGQRASIVNQVLDKTTSSAAEAMRAVFTAISLSNLDRPPRVIAVTSSTPGEGKTTFAAALGGLLTKMNASRRVLLVDLDLRRANLAVAFGVKDRNSPGLGTIDEYLMGTKTLDQCIRRDDKSGVDYICARPDTPNAPEVLESHAMKA
ncbi:MAG: polysaccharide biosynthesis tyrosine autokinase, partial [Alphaproteobacteria bacterium]|nr:polysaccharide biosynthesis tyrosine autokinase [Alphaproteobacteria bacterium]